MLESDFGTGAIKPSSLQSWIKRQTIPRAMASEYFNWAKGVDNSGKISKIKNQFQSSSCYGQSTAYLLEILTGKEISAKSLYAPIRASSGGVFLPDGEKELNDCGANLEATVPSYYESNGSLVTDEAFMSDTSFLTPQNIDEAMKLAGYKSVSINRDMDSIAHAIEEYGHVQVMLPIQNNNSWLSSSPIPPSTSNPNPLNYHYMTFVGAGMPLGYQRLKAVNSWSDKIGENGYQYFQSNYLPYFADIVSYFKPEVIPPVTPVDVPVEIPLQSTSTIAITHPSPLWVSFWNIILQVINSFIRQR